MVGLQLFESYGEGILVNLRSNDATAMRNRLELNSEGPYPSAERDTKFRRCLFTYSIKREIRRVHVIVVQKLAKKCTRAKLFFC